MVYNARTRGLPWGADGEKLAETLARMGLPEAFEGRRPPPSDGEGAEFHPT